MLQRQPKGQVSGSSLMMMPSLPCFALVKNVGVKYNARKPTTRRWMDICTTLSTPTKKNWWLSMTCWIGSALTWHSLPLSTVRPSQELIKAWRKGKKHSLNLQLLLKPGPLLNLKPLSAKAPPPTPPKPLIPPPEAQPTHVIRCVCLLIFT